MKGNNNGYIRFGMGECGFKLRARQWKATPCAVPQRPMKYDPCPVNAVASNDREISYRFKPSFSVQCGYVPVSSSPAMNTKSMVKLALASGLWHTCVVSHRVYRVIIAMSRLEYYASTVATLDPASDPLNPGELPWLNLPSSDPVFVPRPVCVHRRLAARV